MSTVDNILLGRQKTSQVVTGSHLIRSYLSAALCHIILSDPKMCPEDKNLGSSLEMEYCLGILVTVVAVEYLLYF